MSYDEDEGAEEVFKMNSDIDNEDETLDDIPEDLDFGLDEEDPEHDS